MALLLAACAPSPAPAPLPPQTDLAQRAANAGDEAWRRAGLRTVETTVCQLDQLRVVPDARCQDQGCLGWMRQGEIPIAFIRPALAEREGIVAHLAVHEWMHAAGRCYGRWGFTDPYDGNHTDPAVWAGFSWSLPVNAEAIAQGLLAREPDAGPEEPDEPPGEAR